jgi:hypothetical protein
VWCSVPQAQKRIFLAFVELKISTSFTLLRKEVRELERKYVTHQMENGPNGTRYQGYIGLAEGAGRNADHIIHASMG